MLALNRAIISILMACVWSMDKMFLIYVSPLPVMMSREKHPGDWVTVSKTLTSWRMTQCSGIVSKFSLFTFLFLFSCLFPDNIWPFLDADTNGKGPTPKQSTTLQSHYKSWQMHHSLQFPTWPCQYVLFQQKKVLFSFRNTQVHQGWVIINKFLYPPPLSRQN